MIDLGRHFDGTGVQPEGTPGDYGFNVWRNTFPAEELPPAGSVREVAGVPFAFPAPNSAGADNVRCRGQLVEVPAGRYDWLYLLGAAERRTEDEVELHHAGGTVRRSWLRMSDFWPETPARFGEPLAFCTTGLRYPRHTQAGHSPSIWQQRVAIAEPDPLVALRLPDNPAMHVFALTAVADEESRCAR
ncbi:hypothetical protein AB0878_10960 [Amycolatopsis sp. NPDC047767]|uniref:hypothetical protein n=1 Tax=Amycolatopsis sp. NPDC047767 TaxID=3156765 RepID=UPI0034520708